IKFPWYECDRLIGVFGCSIVFGNQSISKVLQQILEIGLADYSSSKTILPGSVIMNTYLTKREAEIAYYLVLGKTAKQIGTHLQLSQRTIEKHVENIKLKMRVTSKPELIEKLIEQLG